MDNSEKYLSLLSLLRLRLQCELRCVADMDLRVSHPVFVSKNKKDGYRQQNVRQQQKLISIIDYDVCMTFY